MKASQFFQKIHLGPYLLKNRIVLPPLTRSRSTQPGNIANELMAEHGAIRAADFRDRTGLGRKRAIQILEYFDRVGFTRKLGHGHGEQHRIRGELPVN